MSGFSPAFLSSTNNSFVDLARAVAPETLPTTVGSDLGHQVPEGTTIVCFRTASLRED